MATATKRAPKMLDRVEFWSGGKRVRGSVCSPVRNGVAWVAIPGERGARQFPVGWLSVVTPDVKPLPPTHDCTLCKELGERCAYCWIYGALPLVTRNPDGTETLTHERVDPDPRVPNFSDQNDAIYCDVCGDGWETNALNMVIVRELVTHRQECTGYVAPVPDGEIRITVAPDVRMWQWNGRGWFRNGRPAGA